ncbi:MAG: tetratricopeptide repeat protein [Planctomycetes bacterium]|nr:tetratricopeptide repeat protein [Planctomycetota bacterium]
MRALSLPLLALALCAPALAAEEPAAPGAAPVEETQLALDSRLAAAARWYEEGRAHLGSGAYDDARHCLEAAVQLDPTLLGAYKGLARAWQHLGVPERELEALERAIANNPVPEALDSSGHLVQMEPRLWLYMDLAAAQRRLARHEDAARTLRAALEHDPGFWSASRLLARVLHEARDQAGSDRVVDAAFQRLCAPADGEGADERRAAALEAVSELYEELGRPEASRRFLS